MPFIDSKITIPVSAERREKLKTELGKAISLLGKTEEYLMVGIQENYDLYMAGEKVDKGAYVSVSLFGNTTPEACRRMTNRICRIYEQELGIPGKYVYITYHGVKDWGWNGKNF